MASSGKAGRGKAYLDTTRSERNAGFTKRGSAASGTDGAHKASHRVVAAALETSSGRGGYGTGAGTDAHAISRAVNHADNVRYKTSYGNRVLDERRDVRIASSLHTGEHLTEATTAARCVQAYRGLGSVEHQASALLQAKQRIGEMTYNNGKPGRPISIRSLAARK